MITFNFSFFNIAPNDRILDIGCGEARHTIKACQQKGTRCVGADIGFKSLSNAQKKIAFHEAINDFNCQSIDLSCMDATALPFKSDIFDLVICSEVLEHIPNDDKAIDELARVLKKGKILAVSVPRFFPEKICWSLSDEYAAADGGHIRIYKKADLIKKIEYIGFSCIKYHHAHSIHTPFWWLKCLVGPERTDSFIVNLYHRLLVWDLMKKPKLTHWMDQLLNPVLGKSLVLYFKKK